MARRYYRNSHQRSKSGRGDPPKPYRSWLEHDLHSGPLKDLPFEPHRISYIIEANYIPDFVNEEKKIIFEAKGRFEDSTEAAKYIHFCKSNPQWKLIFVFERPDCPMPGSRKRKDGTRLTHAAWATKHGFDWCSPATIKDEWL